jgi:hypothetical protein
MDAASAVSLVTAFDVKKKVDTNGSTVATLPSFALS